MTGHDAIGYGAAEIGALGTYWMERSWHPMSCPSPDKPVRCRTAKRHLRGDLTADR